MAAQPHRPRIDPARAMAIAAAHWGLRGEPRELGSYADRNYLFTSPEGRKCVLKLSALSHEPRAVVEMQCAALAHLRTRESAGLVPDTIASVGGEHMLELEDLVGEPCSVRMLSWLEGRLWSELDADTLASARGVALRRSLGRTLAQLDLDLADFEHPGMHRSLRWNLAEATWIAEHLELIAAGGQRELVASSLAQFQARVVPRLADGSLPVQLIHGDANDQNLVVNAPADALSGVFDFGDAVAAPAVCDLAIALAYAAMTDSPLAALAEVCAGYHSRRPLSALELDLVFDLVRARLAVSVVCSTQARAAEPDNSDYIGASEAGAWRLLEQLSRAGRRAVTEAIANDCQLPLPARAPGLVPRTQLLERRHAQLGAALSLSYDEPLYMRRGEGTWLFDEHDQAYLDCVNNVCHVGHCHPQVVAAAREQLGYLNTNTRYLHEGILAYAERLCATLPAPLSVVFLVCSGSEANELALRIARAHTGCYDVAALDTGYHGNTTTLVEISAYKFDGPGGAGKPPWVHLLPTPDPLRGAHGDDGPAYAARLPELAAGAAARSDTDPRSRPGLAALICESVLGCAGQVVPAPGFLAATYAHAREAGAVCIADEVQVGFGRVGDAMWAFEAEGVVPDILTLGKPIGNGHPIGAVVTTPELAASFANGMEYFNTFGGNPVSCAVANAVLEVIETEGLMHSAARTGAWLRQALADDSASDPGVAEVRGRGLFLGIELVGKDLHPDAARAKAVVEYARARGVLLSSDGPGHNVIKIKPPLCFGMVEARLLRAAVASALAAT